MIRKMKAELHIVSNTDLTLSYSIDLNLGGDGMKIIIKNVQISEEDGKKIAQARNVVDMWVDND